MADKSLEERQAEMRKRLTQSKKSPAIQRITVQEKTAESDSKPDDASRREPVITKQPNGSFEVTRQSLYPNLERTGYQARHSIWSVRCRSCKGVP